MAGLPDFELSQFVGTEVPEQSQFEEEENYNNDVNIEQSEMNPTSSANMQESQSTNTMSMKVSLAATVVANATGPKAEDGAHIRDKTSSSSDGGAALPNFFASQSYAFDSGTESEGDKQGGVGDDTDTEAAKYTAEMGDGHTMDTVHSRDGVMAKPEQGELKYSAPSPPAFSQSQSQSSPVRSIVEATHAEPSGASFPQTTTAPGYGFDSRGAEKGSQSDGAFVTSPPMFASIEHAEEPSVSEPQQYSVAVKMDGGCGLSHQVERDSKTTRTLQTSVQLESERDAGDNDDGWETNTPAPARNAVATITAIPKSKPRLRTTALMSSASSGTKSMSMARMGSVRPEGRFKVPVHQSQSTRRTYSQPSQLSQQQRIQSGVERQEDDEDDGVEVNMSQTEEDYLESSISEFEHEIAVLERSIQDKTQQKHKLLAEINSLAGALGANERKVATEKLREQIKSLDLSIIEDTRRITSKSRHLTNQREGLNALTSDGSRTTDHGSGSSIDTSSMHQSAMLPPIRITFHWVQCENCDKWRRLLPDFHPDIIPTNWNCQWKYQNSHVWSIEGAKYDCDVPEEAEQEGEIALSGEIGVPEATKSDNPPVIEMIVEEIPTELEPSVAMTGSQQLAVSSLMTIRAGKDSHAQVQATTTGLPASAGETASTAADGLSPSPAKRSSAPTAPFATTTTSPTLASDVDVSSSDDDGWVHNSGTTSPLRKTASKKPRASANNNSIVNGNGSSEEEEWLGSPTEGRGNPKIFQTTSPSPPRKTSVSSPSPRNGRLVKTKDTLTKSSSKKLKSLAPESPKGGDMESQKLATGTKSYSKGTTPSYSKQPVVELLDEGYEEMGPNVLHSYDIPIELTQMKIKIFRQETVQDVWRRLQAYGWKWINAPELSLDNYWYLRPKRTHKTKEDKEKLVRDLDYFVSPTECYEYVNTCLQSLKAKTSPSKKKKKRERESTHTRNKNKKRPHSSTSSRDIDQMHVSRSRKRRVQPSVLLNSGQWAADFDTQALEGDQEYSSDISSSDSESEGSSDSSSDSNSGVHTAASTTRTGLRSPSSSSSRGSATKRQRATASAPTAVEPVNDSGYDNDNCYNATQIQGDDEYSAKYDRGLLHTRAPPTALSKPIQTAQPRSTTPTAQKQKKTEERVMSHHEECVHIQKEQVESSSSTGEVDVMFAGTKFFFTGIEPNEQRKLIAIIKQHSGMTYVADQRSAVNPDIELRKRVLMMTSVAETPDEAESEAPSSQYEDNELEEVVLVAMPMAYRREKFLLALASHRKIINKSGGTNGNTSVVLVHPSWITACHEARHRVGVAQYSLPLGGSLLRPFARLQSHVPLSRELAKAIPLPWDTVDQSSLDQGSTGTSSMTTEKGHNMQVDDEGCELLSPDPNGTSASGVLSGLNIINLTGFKYTRGHTEAAVSGCDWTTVMYAAGANAVCESPSIGLIESIRDGHRNVDISKENFVGVVKNQETLLSGDVIGVVDLLAFVDCAISLAAEKATGSDNSQHRSQRSQSSTGKSATSAMSLPVLEAAHSWASLHSKPVGDEANDNPASDDSIVKANEEHSQKNIIAPFRILSTEWVVECLVSGIRVAYDEDGTFTPNLETNLEEMDTVPRNKGLFKLPVGEALSHRSVHRCNGARYAVNDTALFKIPTSKSKSKKEVTTVVASDSSESGGKGKIQSFFPTPGGKMLVTLRTFENQKKERLLRDGNTSVSVSAEVTLTETGEITTKADDLQERSLVLRRLDYEYLNYTSTITTSSASDDSNLLLFASDDWEKREEARDVSFAKRYFPHLFCPKPTDDTSYDDEAWNLPMSQDY